MLSHWLSAIPETFKGNAIIGDKHGAKQIFNNFKSEIMPIKKKYFGVNFPSNFIVNIFNSFRQNEDFKTLNWLFQEKDNSKFFYLVNIPCKKWTAYFYIYRNLQTTNVSFLLYEKQEIFKVFFPLKDRAEHVFWVIYEGICNCGKYYIVEIGRNVIVRWNEQSQICLKNFIRCSKREK